VFAVSLVGGPGCGKTTLVDKTIERLTPHVRVGVIAGDLHTHRDADRIARHGTQVVQVNTGSSPCLDALDVRNALEHLDLKSLDLLFIENVGSLTVPETARELGQDATVIVFSVAAGDDKAQKHTDLIETADAVVLNKIDLFFAVPFDLPAFREDVRRANPSTELIELSAATGRGWNRWYEWLAQKVNKRRGCDDASHWFG
jgi:hydrogenase nickel incorporation protein HypB